MAYIGSSATPLPVHFSAVHSEAFSGTGSQTSFEMTRAPARPFDIEVLVNNVQQSPYDGSYSLSGQTLIFSEAPSVGANNVYVIYRDQALPSLIDHSAYRKAEVNGMVDAVATAVTTLAGELDGKQDVLIDGVSIKTVNSASLLGAGDIVISGGATGAGTDRIFWENDKTVTADYTIAAAKNATSGGPIVIADGVTVTIEDGGEWVVV